MRHPHVPRCLLAALAPAAGGTTENTRGSGRYRNKRNRALSGPINGGGPEFDLRTFNSHVYLRKGP